MRTRKLLVVLLSIFMAVTMLSIRSNAASTITTTIDVTKTWDDNNNEDQTRPDHITVYLKNGNTTVKTITIRENNGEWKGQFTDVPVYDSEGKAVTYTVEEAPIPDYEGTIDEGEIKYVFEYPTNIYKKEIDLSPVGAETVDVTGGNGSWKINQGVNSDYITASAFKFNELSIEDCEFTEYDGNGKVVTNAADKLFEVVPKNSNVFSTNQGGVWYYPDVANIASYEGNIDTDHYFTMKFKDGATLLTEDHYGEKVDVTMTVTGLNLNKINYGTQPWTDGRTKMRLFLNNGDILETGPGTDRASLGGIVIDINVQIEGVTSGNFVLPIVDIDTTNNLGPTADPRPESVWLTSDWEKTIYTKKLASTNPTAVESTAFEVKNNMLRAYALAPDTDTFKSGFVGVGNISSDGFDITWKGSTCSTAMFGEIVPYKMKCTVDELIEGGYGGTIAEQGDWRARAYGEAKLIACTPDEHFHIRYIHIDGKNIDLNGFDENGVQTVTTGWTQDINQGTETVTLYQRANGVVEVYLPHQYYAVNDSEPSGRTDHWIDVAYETNGIIGSYEITNKQTVDYDKLSGTKTWYDATPTVHNNEEEVILTLYQIDAKGNEKALDVTPVWEGDTYTFYHLVKTDAEGNKYTYRVEERPINGYRTIYEGDSNENITNIALGDIQVVKKWDDNNDENQVRPDEIIVTLKRDDEVVEDMEDAVVALNLENQWSYEWKGLSLFDDEGHRYVWTVTEDNVPNYEAEYASTGTTLEIVNVYVPVPVTGDYYTSFYIGSAMTVIGLLGMIFTIMKFRLIGKY